MKRKPPSKLWSHVPGVVYPGEKRWARVPGVVYPAKMTRAEQAEASSRARREAREKAEAVLLAEFDAGKSVIQAAKIAGLGSYAARDILRKNGRKVVRMQFPLGANGQPLRDPEIIPKILAAYDSLPPKGRTATKVAAAVGVTASYACKVLKRNGRKILPRRIGNPKVDMAK